MIGYRVLPNHAWSFVDNMILDDIVYEVFKVHVSHTQIQPEGTDQFHRSLHGQILANKPWRGCLTTPTSPPVHTCEQSVYLIFFAIASVATAVMLAHI